VSGRHAGPSGWQRLGTHLAGRKRTVIAVIGWSVVEVLPVLLSGRLVALAVDQGFADGRLAEGLGWLGALGLAMLAGAAGSRQVIGQVGTLMEPLRDALVWQVVTGSLNRSAAVTAGPPDHAAVARLCRQVEVVRDVLAGLLISATQFALAGAAVLVGIGTLSPSVLPLVAGPLAVAIALFLCTLRPMVARQREQLLAEERLTASAGEVLSAMTDIVGCGAQDTAAAGVIALIAGQARVARVLAAYGALRKLTVAVGAYLPMALIVLAAAGPYRHEFNAGSLVGVLVYVGVNLEPALRSMVEGGGNSFQRLAVALDRIAEASGPGDGAGPGEPAPAVEAPGAGEPGRAGEPVKAGENFGTGEAPGNGQARGPRSLADGGRIDRARDLPGNGGQAGRPVAVELREVTFRYGRGAVPTVRAVSMVVPAGGHLAIVGPSGAGKSTLANLLAGLLRPQSGEILLNGRPLSELAGHELSRARTLIPQQAYVFEGTLRENLCYLNRDADEAALLAAVRTLGLSAIAEQAGGLDGLIAPGRLSAGERQLVALTRAYLAPAGLTVLDEATCYMDPLTESRVEEAFRARPGTLIVIAHRISSALRADLVLLMDASPDAPAPRPTDHETLLADSPLYASLVVDWAPDPSAHVPSQRTA
jgi:ATP-binding cassette, subfamily C, bacterial